MNHFLGEYTEPIVLPEGTTSFILEKPICRTCIFWSMWQSGEYGDCEKITNDSGEGNARISVREGELITKPDFGCNLHQLKSITELDR